jgi:hypothetical protein
MAKSNTLLSVLQSEEIYSQLSELYRSEISLTERLFRCRQILENLYKILTGTTNIAFTGLYARMQYVQETFALPQILLEQTQFLRLLTNKVVHKDNFIFNESDFASSIKILAEAVHIFSDKKIPSDIEKYLSKQNAKYLGVLRSPVDSKIDNIFGMVTAWKCSHEKENCKFIEINCQTTDGSEISVTLWEKKEDYNTGRKWTLLDKVLWKYCNISFNNLSLVHGMTNRYQSTPQTLVVLEQDFLVDVSTVADCFQNNDCYPELFLMNKFFSEPITPALAKGKCVNYVFDELINDPQKDLKVIFTEYLNHSPLAVYSLGEEAWQEIFQAIEQDHYPQLRKVASDLQGKACQLEPSFIALKYGLHGRLDAMVLPTEELPKYSIIELKSGNPPKRDVWKAHQMQVVGYNMILREIFGTANIANSSILYSRSMQTSLRHVVNHITAEQDFLMCRNRVIGIMQKLATSPELIINWLKASLRQYCNEFITEKATHIYTVLNALNETEFLWFTNKLKFIFREIWAIKTGAFVENETASFGFSSLWNCSLVEKKKQYRIIDGLWIESVNTDVITFHRQDDITLSNFRIGDIIVMYKQDIPVMEQQLIRGTISVINEEKIEIKTRSKLRTEGVFDNYTLWAIEPDLMESSLYNGLSSLYSFLCADVDDRARLLGFTPPRFSVVEVPSVISWRNDVAESLKGMISAQDYYLVQGPPGTGKTSCLLMQYIAYLKSETAQKVLIISFTNRAVDEICCHLEAEHIEYSRIGNSNQSSKINGSSNGTNGAAKETSDKQTIDYEQTRIFVSTLHSFLAVAADLLHKITIDELIIDEASQLMEHQVIGLMSKIRKSILIGDQNQLPPIIMQNTDTDRESILERMIASADKKIFPKCYSMLTNHYRMHNEIAHLVSHNYLNKLVAGSKNQSVHHPWIKSNNKNLAEIFKARVVWIDTQPSYQSKADTMQAKWIKNFIDVLSKEMPADEIISKVGVISPFRAQAQCIITALGKKYKALTVDTVERFQGSQRECIIMSYPIRYQYELNMLQSINSIGTIDRKLNVALSRAKEQLIIIGNSRILAHSEFYHKVYNLIKEKGVVICGNTLADN